VYSINKECTFVYKQPLIPRRGQPGLGKKKEEREKIKNKKKYKNIKI